MTKVRYLGVYMVSSRVSKCSLHRAKCGFYRAANAIFGKVGRVSSEEVILQLIKSNDDDDDRLTAFDPGQPG